MQKHKPHYDLGKQAALRLVGITRSGNPYSEVQRQLSRVFNVKMPEFNMGKEVGSLFNNPFKQVGNSLNGGFSKLRV